MRSVHSPQCQVTTFPQVAPTAPPFLLSCLYFPQSSSPQKILRKHLRSSPSGAWVAAPTPTRFGLWNASDHIMAKFSVVYAQCKWLISLTICQVEPPPPSLTSLNFFPGSTLLSIVNTVNAPDYGKQCVTRWVETNITKIKKKVSPTSNFLCSHHVNGLLLLSTDLWQ